MSLTAQESELIEAIIAVRQAWASTLNYLSFRPPVKPPTSQTYHCRCQLIQKNGKQMLLPLKRHDRKLESVVWFKLFCLSFDYQVFVMNVLRFLLSSSQLQCSTSATQTTMWMRVMALWRCRCGVQGPIFPKEEPSQCAPERQILFQLRVCGGTRYLSL